MEPQNELLAQALTEARSLSQNAVVRSASLDRGARERLIGAGYLEEVMRGWYLLTTPMGVGTTTLWFSSYWEFIKQYLEDRFAEDGYCFSAESSLEIHSGKTTVPKQLVILTKNSSNQTVELKHGTSLLLIQDKSFPAAIENRDGLNILPLPESICRLSPSYFVNSSLNVEIALKLLGSASDVSRVLLQTGSVASASRIAGAFEKLGEQEKSKQIVMDMGSAGYTVSPTNPFEKNKIYLKSLPRITSPYAGRITAMWEKMRSDVEANFPEPLGKGEKKSTLKDIERLYQQDAYNSLSIEGYRVTEELIARVKEGRWNPDKERQDRDQMNAMAAKGYSNTFKAVCESIKKVQKGKDAADVFEDDLQNWYRDLFAPAVQSKLLAPSQLAGYRNGPVYIQGSFHVPPPVTAVVDSMETFFGLLKNEKNPAVRAVLGHFIFVYIHPYVDGNGRIGRFIMNLMLVAGDYNWTVIRVSEKDRYLKSLEAASVQGDIRPFTKFVADEMNYWRKKGRLKKEAI